MLVVWAFFFSGPSLGLTVSWRIWVVSGEWSRDVWTFYTVYHIKQQMNHVHYTLNIWPKFIRIFECVRFVSIITYTNMTQLDDKYEVILDCVEFLVNFVCILTRNSINSKSYILWVTEFSWISLTGIIFWRRNKSGEERFSNFKVI